MPNEFAKNKSPLIENLMTAVSQIEDGVLAFQEAVAELQEFGLRLRATSDKIRGKAATLDDSFGDMQFPKGVLRKADGEEAIGK
jgi:hypothetical protein